MTIAWLLNAIGLYATTVGALLILAHLLSSPHGDDDSQTSEAKRAVAMDRRKLALAVGLLCLWLVIQDVAVLLL